MNFEFLKKIFEKLTKNVFSFHLSVHKISLEKQNYQITLF